MQTMESKMVRCFRFMRGAAMMSGLVFLLSCIGSPDYDVVSSQLFGKSEVFYVLAKTQDDSRLEKASSEIAGQNKFAYVFFYANRAQIPDLRRAANLADAIPEVDFVAKFTSDKGYRHRPPAVLYSTTPSSGALTIRQIDQETRLGVFRKYIYFVENYVDLSTTDNEMENIARNLPVDSDGSTQVWFFNDKVHAPKLNEEDRVGGWNPNQSASAFNYQYGKYCVGYYHKFPGENGVFTKGVKDVSW